MSSSSRSGPAREGRQDRRRAALAGLERGDHARRVRVAAGGLLRGGAHRDRGEPAGDGRVRRPRVGHRLGAVLHGHGDEAVAAEGQLPGQALVEHDAQRVDVGARVDRAAVGLLGREVVGAPDEHVGARDAGLPVRVEGARDPEVGELHGPVAGEEDVLGLDVAVDHPLRLGVGQGAADLGADAGGLGGRQRPLAPDARLEVLPLHELHDEVGALVVLAPVEQVHEVRVRQAGHQEGLAAEPLGVLLVGQEPRVQALHRHVAAQHGVARSPDRRHSAAADQLVEAVALPEQGLRHGRRPASAIVTHGGYRQPLAGRPVVWSRIAACPHRRPS